MWGDPYSTTTDGPSAAVTASQINPEPQVRNADLNAFRTQRAPTNPSASLVTTKLTEWSAYRRNFYSEPQQRSSYLRCLALTTSV